jgi:hypothetical protein
MQFDSWVCSILRGPILYVGHTPRIPSIRPCMPPAMHVCLCTPHYMRQPPLSPTSLVARWTLNYARNGTIRRIREGLAGCINRHGAKTGSRRARRSAPAHLVWWTLLQCSMSLVDCFMTLRRLDICTIDLQVYTRILNGCLEILANRGTLKVTDSGKRFAASVHNCKT